MSNYRQEPIFNVENIQKIQQELGRLFEGNWVSPSSRSTGTGDWSPDTDTIESDSEWLFLIDLPGIELTDIDVSVHRGEIVVKGIKSSSGFNANDGNFVNRERSHGAFEKKIRLPNDTDESTLNASMKNGVLQLSVNKSSSSGARPIQVNAVD